MQDLLKKIIEIDEQTRETEQQAKREKLKSEEEVERLREQIYNDFIERAKDRVEKNIAVEQELADQRVKAYEDHTKALRQEMRDSADRNTDRWVDEIVGRALA